VVRTHSFALAITASLAVHVLIAMAWPRLNWTLPVTAERLVEVEIDRREPEPLPPKPLPLEKPKAPAAGTDGGPARVSDEILRSLAPAAEAPAAPIRLPARDVLIPEPETLPWTRPVPVEREAVPKAPLSRAPAPSAPDLAAARSVAKSLLEAGAGRPPLEAPRETSAALDIQGPVGTEREVVHRPPFPAVPIPHPADVVIRFWVSPRGTVTRTVVQQTADPELDRTALAYVKGIRFNALVGGDKDQWGVIRVKFRFE